MHKNLASPSNEVALNRCQNQLPTPVLTAIAPVRVQETLYVATHGQLYAVNASNWTERWCQQVTLSKEFRYHPGISHPPSPIMLFGTPQVTNGMFYICVSGYGNYTYAFNAEDGTLRWRTPTDAWRVSIPFEDFAIPIVRDGVVYTGIYALNEQNGTVL